MSCSCITVSATLWCNVPHLTHLPFAVKTEDLKADAWRAARLDFVQVPEQVETSSASSVIQLTLCQDAQESGLPRVNIPQNGHTQVQKLYKQNTG